MHVKNPDLGLDQVMVRTIDAFEGGEKELAIMDLTVSERIGFLPLPNRIKVGLTRGRTGLYVFLNRDAIQVEKRKGSLYARYYDDRGHLRDVVSYVDDHDMYVSTDRVLHEAARNMQHDCLYDIDEDLIG